jgi:hypothetical protein
MLCGQSAASDAVIACGDVACPKCG